MAGVLRTTLFAEASTLVTFFDCYSSRIFLYVDMLFKDKRASAVVGLDTDQSSDTGLYSGYFLSI